MLKYNLFFIIKASTVLNCKPYKRCIIIDVFIMYILQKQDHECVICGVGLNAQFELPLCLSCWVIRIIELELLLQNGISAVVFDVSTPCLHSKHFHTVDYLIMLALPAVQRTFITSSDWSWQHHEIHPSPRLRKRIHIEN